MISTTVEQSKSLLSIGLDRSTADMVWRCYAKGGYRLEVLHREVFEEIGVEDIHAWSLKALIDSLPQCSGDDVYVWHLIKNANAYNDIKEPFYMCEVIRNADKKHGWWCEFGKDEFDAIVRLVCLLDAMGTGIIKKGGAS